MVHIDNIPKNSLLAQKIRNVQLTLMFKTFDEEGLLICVMNLTDTFWIIPRIRINELSETNKETN